MFGIYLGIDLRADSVVATQLENRFSGIAHISSKVLSVTDGYESIAQELAGYIEGLAVKPYRVFVSIPDSWTLTGFINVPSVKGRGKTALENMVRFEIEKHIPYEMDSVEYDFLILDKTAASYSVIFSVIKKDKLETVKTFLEKVSLLPHSVTLSSLAAMNAAVMSGVSSGGWHEITGISGKSRFSCRKGEVNLYIHFESRAACIALIGNGILKHLRSFSINTPEELNNVQDNMAISAREALSKLHAGSFSRVILSGDIPAGSACAGKLENGDSFKTEPVEQASNFGKNPEGAETGDILSSSGACLAGLGTGPYGINYLPHKAHDAKRISPVITIILLVLAVLLFMGIFAVDTVRQKKYLAAIEAGIARNEPAVKELEELVSENELNGEMIKFLKNAEHNETTLEILAELSVKLPGDSWIINLDYKGIDLVGSRKDKGELIISGFAESSSNLISLLEDSAYFEKVEFIGPIKKTKDKEQFKLGAGVVKR